MQVEGLRSGISKSSNKARWNKDGRGKGEGSVRMPDTKVYQGYLKVPGIGKLLSPIHTGLCIHSKTVI